MIGTSQLINTFSRPCFTDTTDIFKDGSGVALYGLDYDASDAGGASGKFGEAAIFNGSSSVITINSAFDFSSSFSISMWFNAETLTSSTYMPLFFTDGYGGSNSDYGVALYLYGNTIKPWIDRQGTYTNIFTAGTLSTGTWYHVVLNRDYNSKWELFLNGSSLGTYTGVGLTDNYTPSSFSTIGKHSNANTWFDGKIDQVRIFNTALTQSQVTQLYQENNSTVGTHLFGCIANYNLDGSAKESMGTTAYDGTETDITYRYDGTPTAVDFGVGGKSDYGARFNGSSSYIDTSVSVIPATNYSVSMWVFHNSLKDGCALYTQYRGSVAGRHIVNSNANGTIQINTGSVNSLASITATPFTTGVWQHLVVTKSSSTGYSVYIDGSSIGTWSNTDSIIIDQSTQFGGDTEWSGNHWLDGKLDQVRIFSKALSSAEVGKLYGNGAGEIACTYTSTTDDVTYPIANTAYYKLDNNSKDSARSTGRFNEGAIFNGSSSRIQIASTSTDPVNISTGTFSVSMWVNMDNLTNNNKLVYKWGTTAANRNFLFTVLNTSGYLYFIEGTTGGDVLRTGTFALSINTWHHIALTREQGGNLKMYVDGDLKDTFSAIGTFKTSSEPIYLGYQVGQTTNFTGKIDQVRIYNTALSSTDVSNLYAETASDTSTLSFPSGKTAIATYQLDGNSTDLSGNYNGTDTNITYAYDGTESNIEYRFGRYGQAAVFNGSTSYIESGISTNILNSDYTISFWGKSSNSSGGQTFINTNSGAVAFVRIDFSADGNLYFYHRNSASTTYVDASIVSGMADGNWHHVVITKDNTSVKAYKDGSLVGTITSTSGTYSNSTTLQIGRNNYNANGANNFDGDIDQVRIYSSALTSSQVTQLYNEKPEVDTSNFKTVLYTGNGGTQYISNVGFDLETNGGLVWIKSRTLAASHGLYDFVRGAGYWLRSDSTDAQQFQRSTGYLSSFDSNGFTLSEGSSTHPTYTASYETHQINQDYVAWVFKAGGEAVQNTQGSITSDVSANTEAGFSIVKFTIPSSGSSATVAHELSSAPQFMLVKTTEKSGSWFVYTEPTGAGGEFYLEATSAFASQPNRFANTAPTSTVFTLGSSFLNATYSGAAIAYCWHSVAGYSKIGSYTGNGSSSGQTITGLGFNPRFLLVKNTTSSAAWRITDSARGDNIYLYPNLSNGEDSSSGYISLITDGFRMNGLDSNTSDTFIYMAFK